MPTSTTTPIQNNQRPGHKHTKLGWLPEEWEVVRLNDISKKVTVGIASSATHAYQINGVPLFRNQNIKPGKLDDGDVLFVNKEYDEQYKNKRLLGNDILTCRTGYPGVSCLVPERYAGAQSFTTLVTRLKNGVEPRFIVDFINSPKGIKFFKRSEIGGGQKNVGAKTLAKMRIPLPPLPEQKAIANCLATWDRALTTTRELLTTLQQRKKGLMQELLSGRRRLPGFEGEWEEVKLDDIVKRVKSKNVELNDNVVTISAQRGFVRQEDFFNKRVASKTLQGYYLIQRGDFAYNKSYSKGYPMGAFKRLDDFNKAVVTTLYICFRALRNVNTDYLLQYFEGGRMVQNLMKIAQEGGRAHGLLNIGLSDFFGLNLTLPSLEEQTAIASVLTAADREITLYEQKLTTLEAQKKGLMQQLLTGQKRLPH